jgi:Short C-terminal domain
VGLFHFLRRKDQSAMPDPDSPEFQQMVEGSALSGSEQTGVQSWASVGDATSAEELGRRAAAQLGIDPSHVQVEQGASQTLDLRGSGAREQILGLLRQHGIDPDKPGQQVDASTIPGLQQAIVSLLGEHGVQIPPAGGVGGYVGSSAKADPIAQIEHLAAQRDAGKITEAEFEAQKKSLLGE